MLTHLYKRNHSNVCKAKHVRELLPHSKAVVCHITPSCERAYMCHIRKEVEGEFLLTPRYSLRPFRRALQQILVHSQKGRGCHRRKSSWQSLKKKVQMAFSISKPVSTYAFFMKSLNIFPSHDVCRRRSDTLCLQRKGEVWTNCCRLRGECSTSVLLLFSF